MEIIRYTINSINYILIQHLKIIKEFSFKTLLLVFNISSIWSLFARKLRYYFYYQRNIRDRQKSVSDHRKNTDENQSEKFKCYPLLFPTKELIIKGENKNGTIGIQQETDGINKTGDQCLCGFKI
jgi:hypothetical protein